MKTLVIASSMFALLLSVGIAQEKKTVGEKAADAVDKTKEVAKDAGRAVADKTKKAVEVVKDAVTPDKDAHRVEVKLMDGKIEMPSTTPPGKTAFVVTNTSTRKHNFGVEGNGTDKKFITAVDPNETKTLHVDLKTGNYKAYCPVSDHNAQGMKVDLLVK